MLMKEMSVSLSLRGQSRFEVAVAAIASDDFARCSNIRLKRDHRLDLFNVIGHDYLHTITTTIVNKCVESYHGYTGNASNSLSPDRLLSWTSPVRNVIAPSQSMNNNTSR